MGFMLNLLFLRNQHDRIGEKLSVKISQDIATAQRFVFHNGSLHKVFSAIGKQGRIALIVEIVLEILKSGLGFPRAEFSWPVTLGRNIIRIP